MNPLIDPTEIELYSKNRVFNVKLLIIGLVLLAGLVGIVHIMNTVEAYQSGLDTMVDSEVPVVMKNEV